MKIFSTVTLVEIEPDNSYVKALQEGYGLSVKRMGYLTVEFSDSNKKTAPVVSYSGEPDEAFYSRANTCRESLFRKHEREVAKGAQS